MQQMQQIIHAYVEIKVEDSWEKVGEVFHNPFNEGKDDKNNSVLVDQPPIEFNPILFALLGNLDYNTSNLFSPITYLKSLPEDVSYEVKERYEMENDPSKASYLTLKDFHQFDWEQVITRRGWVPLEVYIRYTKYHKRPDYFVDNVYGHVEKLTSEQADFQMSHQVGQPKKNQFVFISWAESYEVACTEFTAGTLPLFEQLKQKAGVDHKSLRMVYWFTK